jgi:monoamine oxidase
MLTTRVAIIGGGLAGLYAATLLEARGVSDYVLLEVRDELGGRIQRASAPGVAEASVDLGATWFWPEGQPEFAALLARLGLASFEQDESQDMLVERSLQGPPMRTRGYAAPDPSMRVVGGMGQLIGALRQQLAPASIRLGQKVQQLRRVGGEVDIVATDDDCRVHTYRAAQVLLAIPPRLAAGLEYSPGMPESLLRAWRQTPTWMAPHAKYVAIYPEPFWRAHGLSGFVHSAVGPLAEIHDASDLTGYGALFGFVGLPAATRRKVADEVLRQHCRMQLARLFGPSAASPVFDTIKDWARDPHTATHDDLASNGEHPLAPPAGVESGEWGDRLFGIASEWSPQFSGYAAGAVEAARRGVEALLRGRNIGG